jgi:hypothetical protein
MKTRKRIVWPLSIFFGIWGAISIAGAAEFHFLAHPELPEIVDGARQVPIVLRGVARGDFKDIRITAKWVDRGQTETSPPLQRDGDLQFEHTFGTGGQKCGRVSFSASAKIGKTTMETEKKGAWVDCAQPRVLIGSPVNGQAVKANTNMTLELRLEDDLMNMTGYPYGLAKHALTVEVDGVVVFSPSMTSTTPAVQKISVPIKEQGRHAVTVTFRDPTKKSDQRTVWVNADAAPPTVRIISPAPNERVSISTVPVPALTVSVEASDPGGVEASGIERVEFYRDGQGVASVNASSGDNRYVGVFGVPEGRSTIKVIAFDKVGNKTEANTTVDVIFEGPTVPGGLPAAPKKKLPR